jgi:hypothetical protein
VVSSRKDKVADESFVAVDYKISTKFFWLFVFAYELRRAEPPEVAAA